MIGTIFDIQRFSVHDGPGIRTTVFLKGCPLRCAWCHNPEGLSAEIAVQYFRDACIHCGSCSGEKRPEDVSLCPGNALRFSGRQIRSQALLAEILSDRPFYGSEGGVTFSGGECLLQADFVAHMLRLCKEAGIATAVDTCGCVPWESLEKTLACCDLYLYDIKLADPILHKRYTGADNRLILQNLHRLVSLEKPIWIRVPLIPSVNDDPRELKAIADIAAGLSGVSRVTLIPYHALGKTKYATLGMVPGYDCPDPVSPEQLQKAKDIFRQAGLTVED